MASKSRDNTRIPEKIDLELNPYDMEEEEREEPSQEQEIEEEEPEAFTPSFTVAPDEIPPEQTAAFTPNIPSEEEQRGILEKLAGKLGADIKQAMQEPTQPLTPEKEKLVTSVGALGGNLMSAGVALGFSLFGPEYNALAPSPEEGTLIIEPLWRIYVRHSKIAGNLTPDMNDVILSMTALSGYIEVSIHMFNQIREDKRLNGQVTQSQVRPSFATPRQAPIGEQYTTTNSEYAQNSGVTPPVDTSKLDDNQRHNYEALRVLSERDYNYRVRRSGRF